MFYDIVIPFEREKYIRTFFFSPFFEQFLPSSFSEQNKLQKNLPLIFFRVVSFDSIQQGGLLHMYFFLSTAPLPFYDGGFFSWYYGYCWYLLVSFLFSMRNFSTISSWSSFSSIQNLHLPSYFLITVIFFLDIFYAIQCMPQGNFLFWLPMYPIHWWCTRNFTVKNENLQFQCRRWTM